MNPGRFKRDSVNGGLRHLIGRLRRSVASCTAQVGAPTDAQLLEAFVQTGDEGAFEMLVWRYGTMVYNVCRRILKDRHETEDAFQATFLVFFRKASTIRRHDAVGGWLYRVAYRVGCAARSISRQTACQQHNLEMVRGKDSAEADIDWRDVAPQIDEEINRLPEKLRVPVVLCYLQGSSLEEVAATLSVPVGTVGSRLARGKDRLRSRLARRGVTLSATVLAASLAQNASAAGMPMMLVRSVVDTASHMAAGSTMPAAVLAEQVLRTMTAARLAGLAARWLGLVMLAAGVASAALWVAGAFPVAQERKNKVVRTEAPAPPEQQREPLQNNKPVPPAQPAVAQVQSFDLPEITTVVFHGKGAISLRKGEKNRLIVSDPGPCPCVWKVDVAVLSITGNGARFVVEAKDPAKIRLKAR